MFGIGRFQYDGLLTDNSGEIWLGSEIDAFLGFGPGYLVLSEPNHTWRVQAGPGVTKKMRLAYLIPKSVSSYLRITFMHSPIRSLSPTTLMFLGPTPTQLVRTMLASASRCPTTCPPA